MAGHGMTDLAELAKGFGAAGPVILLLLYLYHQERTERRELQKENTEMFRGKLSSDTAFAAVLEKIADKVGA